MTLAELRARVGPELARRRAVRLEIAARLDVTEDEAKAIEEALRRRGAGQQCQVKIDGERGRQ